MERIYKLNPSDKISLAENPAGGKNLKEWEISSIVGEGSFSVCYSAKSSNTFGRLKEFYPIDTKYLKRRENNQLVAEEKFSESFCKQCADYLNVFELLKKVRNENEVLNNFLPVYEIFYGYDDSGAAGSVYLWTPHDKHGVRFDEYLKKVRDNPADNAATALFNIVQAITHLTECIKIFHKIGLLHLDIKPSNFLITSDGEKINPKNISLFDLNSICDLSKVTSDFTIIGTEGFSAPELKSGRLSNRCDIFSIGATLFYGTVIDKKIVSDGLYRINLFSSIPQLVARSELLNVSTENENVEIKSLLTTILKKCLAFSPNRRYCNCEELLSDLESLLTLLTPAATKDTLKTLNKKIILTDADAIQDSTIILQNLLYKSPLITAERNSQHVNIAVIGGGTFAQKFIDQALQSLQVPYVDAGKFFDREVNIKVFSRSADYDREVYLNFRPALKDFINVNGSLKNSSAKSYAVLDFLSITATDEKGIADEVMARCEKIDYVFISLGDDNLNKATAEEFAARINCPVHFVVKDSENLDAVEDFNAAEELSPKPVYVSEKITPETISPQLERAAFNTHISWLGALGDVDFDTARKDFLERYNHESSLSFALSILYKLRALNIDDTDYVEAAKTFAEKISDENILRHYAYFEHRRWVVQRLIEGWKPPLNPAGRFDYDHCLTMLRQNGKPQDTIRFFHHCIVRSERDWTLRDHPEQWDNPTKNLDELDRMSVELHREIAKKAADIKSCGPFVDLKIISEKLVNYENLKPALNLLEFRLEQIITGNVNHSKKLKNYFAEFQAELQKLNDVPTYIKSMVTERLENMRRNWILIAESNIKRDYKAYDFVLVENIPFILTYSMPHIVKAFNAGQKPSEIFRNVDSASILNPSRITFLYCFDVQSQLSVIADKIDNVQNYFRSRKIAKDIQFIVAVKSQDENLCKDVAQIFKDRAIPFNLRVCKDDSDAAEFFLDELKKIQHALYDGSSALFSSQHFQSIFAQKVYERFAYFELDDEKKFSVCHNCEYLKFIADKPSLRLNEILALDNLKLLAVNTFYEYANFRRQLWGIYIKNRAAFNRLSKLLRQYDENPKNFVSVKIPKVKLSSALSVKYFLIGHTKKSAKFMLKKLVELGLVKNFTVNFAGDSIAVDISTYKEVAPYLNELFADAANLIDPSFIKIRQVEDAVTVCLSNLKIKSLAISDDAEIKNLLNGLSKEHFILNLKFRKSRAGFDYASTSIKKFLMTEDILKYYLYFEILANGSFDEVLADIEFAPKNLPNEKSCLDFVLIKGFNCIVIGVAETESIKNLQQFNQAAEELGFTSKKIFIVAEDNLSSEFIGKAKRWNISVVKGFNDIAAKLAALS